MEMGKYFQRNKQLNFSTVIIISNQPRRTFTRAQTTLKFLLFADLQNLRLTTKGRIKIKRTLILIYYLPRCIKLVFWRHATALHLHLVHHKTFSKLTCKDKYKIDGAGSTEI